MGDNQAMPKRKKRSPYFSQVLVLTLLLFVLGVFSNIIYQAYEYSLSFKKNQFIRIELAANANKDEVIASLLKKGMYSKVDFISKDDGLKLLQGNSTIIPEALIDSNPLPDLINAYVTDKLSPLQIEQAAEDTRTIQGVKSVGFLKKEAKLLDKTIDTLSWIMLLLFGLLLIIAFFIIDSTVRLAIYSNRMLIRSMQLIGATRGFIRKPYILQSITNALLSAFIAIILLAGIYAALHYYFPELELIKKWMIPAIIAGALVLFGIVFTMFSTFVSVNKYLRMKLDELY